MDIEGRRSFSVLAFGCVDKGVYMTLKRSLTFLALLVCSTAGLGQVTILPASPTALDLVRIRLPASALPQAWNPSGTTVSMAANKVTIVLGLVDFSAFIPPKPVDWPIGQLPAGTYQVELQYDQKVVGTAQFSVSARRSQGPLWNHTDMWWNSTESGWGASIQQHGSGTIFGTFFIYAADGTATWYVLPGGHWTSTTEFDGDVYQTRGPQLETFDPHNVSVSLVGSAAITFSETDPEQATLSLTIGARTIQKAIQRQSF